MRLKIPSLIKLKVFFATIAFLFSINISFDTYAEGTKELSPDINQITSLVFTPSSGVGSNFGAAQEDRIYFRIGNHTIENFYFGLGNFVSGGTAVNNVYYRILNSAGTVVQSPILLDRNQLDTHAKALAGANINGTAPTGYTPLLFDPSLNGDFYIEIYRSSDLGVTSNSTAFNIPFFDFQVSNAAGDRINGRTYAEKWSFRAGKPSDNWVGAFADAIDPILYSYINDNIVVKVEFTDFQPLAFIPAFNHYGVNSNQTDWFIGRKSVTSGGTAPTLVGGFKTFLNEPDPLIYPSATLAQAPSINGNVIGCIGSYLIPYLTNVDGDVRFLLDLNGVPGLQSGTTDRVLEAINVIAGNNFMPWDGLDGLGNPISENTSITSTLTMLRGRINMPVYDAEVNSQGLKISMVAPIVNTNIPLFWDDSILTNITGNGTNLDNTTGTGVNNSFLGQNSPGHAWNGVYGNTLLAAPIIATTDGNATTDASDDFGNLRTINTWFWGLEEPSNALNFRLPYCLTVGGTIFNDSNGLSNSIIDGAGSDFGTLYVYLINNLGDIVAIDTVNVNGTYIFDKIDSGDYTIRISTNTGIVGNPAPSISYPINFLPIGEGTAASGDGLSDGETSVQVVSSNIAGVNFGLDATSDLEVAKTSSNLTPLVGSNITFSIIVTNNGPDFDPNVVVQDILPAGYNYVSSTTTVGTYDSITGAWTIGNLNLNQIDTLLVVAQVNELGSHLNVAIISGTNVDPVVANDTSSITITYLLPIEAINDLSTGHLPGVNAVLDLIANDTLSDGNPATAAEVTVDLDLGTLGIDNTLTVPGEGIWTYNSVSGQITFDPNTGFTKDPTPIIYELTEIATGLKDSATVTIDYIEGSPAALNDSNLNNTPGQTVTLNLLTNDILSDGSSAISALVSLDLDPSTIGIQLSITIVGEGTYTYNASTGVVTFVPLLGFLSSPTPISYELIETLTGLKDAATITITYNAFPYANDDEDLNNLPGIVGSVNVLTNDTLSTGLQATVATANIDLDTSTVGVQTSRTLVGQGTYAYNTGTGLVEFTPLVSFFGNPTPFIYNLIEIATGLSNAATLTITYLLPIEAINDLRTGHLPGVNAVLDIIANDTLSDGNPATAAEVTMDLDLGTPGIDQTLTVPGEGIWTYNTVLGQVTFDPNTGFTKDPTPIIYELTEIATGLKDSATITIDYIEGPPAAINDWNLNNTPGQTVTLNLLTNDILSDGSSAISALVSLDLDPSTIGIQLSRTIVGEGTYTYNASTGVVTFVPLLGFLRSPTPISYELIETLTGLKDAATITITYLIPIDADDNQSLNNIPGTNVILNILQNDSLSTGLPSTSSLVTVDLDQTTIGIELNKIVANQGTWTYSQTTGLLTFDPNPGFTIDPTPISYLIKEIATGLSDSALVTVAYIKIPPIANPDYDLDNTPNSIVIINLLANDKVSDVSNANSTLATIDFEPTLLGNQYSLLVPGEGNYAYNPLNGEVSFTPIPGFYTNPIPVEYTLTELLTGLKDTSIINITYLFSPKLELIKTANLSGSGVAGDVITYSFTVINTGNVPITGVTISDSMLSASPIIVTPTGLSPLASGVASATYTIKASDIALGEVSNSATVSGLSSQGNIINDISDNGDLSQPGKSKPTVLKFNSPPIVDLNLTKSIVGNCQRQIRDTVTFVIAITREDTSSLPVDFTVKDSLGTNWQFVSATPSEGSFNSVSGLWSGISILKSDTARLIVKALILTNSGGLMCNEAWIESSSISDADSNPGDQAPAEDDFSKACISVPINLCSQRNETVTINAEPGHISYQWLKDGVTIQGATSETYLATQAGTYTYLLDGIGCSIGACCSIIVQSECECAPQICIPIKISKIK